MHEGEPTTEKLGVFTILVQLSEARVYHAAADFASLRAPECPQRHMPVPRISNRAYDRSTGLKQPPPRSIVLAPSLTGDDELKQLDDV